MLIVNSLLFLLLSLFFPIRYETNDDVFLSLLANGIYTGSPETHLVFINALYGEVLRLLYTYIPIVEWYALIMAILSIISASIIVVLVKEKLRDCSLKIVFTVTFYILWAIIIQRFQFTTTASISAIAGMLLFLGGWRIRGGLLFLIASLLRFESAGLIGILFVPLICCIYRGEIKKYLSLLVLVFTCSTFHVVDRTYYLQGEWNEFYQYNKWRARVFDNPNAVDFNKLPKDISKNDVLSALDCCSDGDIIKTDQLRQIYNVQSGNDFKTKIFKTVDESGLFRYTKDFLFIIVLAIALLISLEKKQKMLKVSIILNCILAICLFVLISFNYDIKYRIVWGCILVVIIYGIYSMNYIRNIYFKRLIAVIMIAYSFSNISILAKQMKEFRYYTPLYNEQKTLLTQSNSKYILYPAKTFLLTYAISPFQMHTFFKPNQIIWKSWLNNYPSNRHSSRNDIVVDSDVNMIMNRWYDLSVYNNTLLEHYGYVPDTTIIERTDNYYIVKFTKPKE